MSGLIPELTGILIVNNQTCAVVKCKTVKTPPDGDQYAPLPYN